MSIPISQLIPPHLLLLLGVRMFIFYVCLYFCFVNWYRLSMPIFSDYTVFFSYLLHSAWWYLGSSMSLQMIQFCSFLWRRDSLDIDEQLLSQTKEPGWLSAQHSQPKWSSLNVFILKVLALVLPNQSPNFHVRNWARS